MKNEYSIDTLCASLAYAMGIEKPNMAADPNKLLNDYIDKAFCGGKADRIFMYNPDAIGQWIFEKYQYLLEPVIKRTEINVPFATVMPSVTPVCFGTIYTGTQPSVHGIQTYAKPVIKTDSIFDALIRCGKKPVIIAENDCSMAKIYLERDMDYFVYDTIEEVNAKAAEIIIEDKYDFVAVYNGNYDSIMHRSGPESTWSLAQLQANAQAYATFYELIKSNWKGHKTLAGFAMDHGCHEIDGGCGSHGLDMDEDINIIHCYTAIK